MHAFQGLILEIIEGKPEKPVAPVFTRDKAENQELNPKLSSTNELQRTTKIGARNSINDEH